MSSLQKRRAHPSKLHRWSIRNKGVAGLGDLLCLALQVVNYLDVCLDCTYEIHAENGCRMGGYWWCMKRMLLAHRVQSYMATSPLGCEAL